MGAAAMTDMTMTDATTLASLLTELRLPSIARNWKRITEAANREGWPAQKTLATLLEIEVAERASRRIQRHRDQSETPVGKTFASFDFTAAPELSKPHLLALGAGGDWIKNGDNLLVFGSGGIANATIISSGGTLGVARGGTDLGAQISGGIEIDSGLASGTVVFGAYRMVSKPRCSRPRGKVGLRARQAPWPQCRAVRVNQ